jgi:transglutaminase-like putative cysteine protease
VLSVAAAVATLAITGALFFVIPRIGQATLPLRMKVTRMVSGFSERVSLGAFGEIETDAAIVMRVHVRETIPAPDRLPGVRWRGIALDHFDGTAWTRDDQDRITIRRMPHGPVHVARARGTGPSFTQEIYLEPLGTQVLFAAPRILRIGIRADAVTIDAGGTVSVGSTAARLRYVVDSELETAVPRLVAGGRETLDADARGRYLQLPPLAPRVRSLARQVAGDAPEPVTAATRLATFLSERYRYTRVLDRQTSLPPVEEFLFVTRSGNCEYFAAALAVMLRTLGIPSRVVNGFQRGEWNPYGGYFMVRLLDAHSWVEAHVDGAGWFTLDPSPRGGQETAAAPGPVNLYLDALRLRWYRYVVNWSLQDQVTAAGKVRAAATTWTPSLGWVRRPGDVRGLAVGLAVALAIAAGVLLVGRRARGRDRRARATQRPPRFYERALKVLARRGWRPGPAETAREFAARVAAAVPATAEPLASLTGGYERARFAEAALSGEELRELDHAVAVLKSTR